MAEPGHSFHPSARGRGRTERRTPGFLWLLLWTGTAFQVTLGTGQELHACKEVLSAPQSDPTLIRKLLNSVGDLGDAGTVLEATEFRFLWG
jgi:hypothetical protein